jgi:hypothetical protein
MLICTQILLFPLPKQWMLFANYFLASKTLLPRGSNRQRDYIYKCFKSNSPTISLLWSPLLVSGVGIPSKQELSNKFTQERKPATSSKTVEMVEMSVRMLVHYLRTGIVAISQ